MQIAILLVLSASTPERGMNLYLLQVCSDMNPAEEQTGTENRAKKYVTKKP